MEPHLVHLLPAGGKMLLEVRLIPELALSCETLIILCISIVSKDHNNQLFQK